MYNQAYFTGSIFVATGENCENWTMQFPASYTVYPAKLLSYFSDYLW